MTEQNDRLMNFAARLDVAKDIFVLLVCGLLIGAVAGDEEQMPFIIISVFALTALFVITVVLSGIMKAARR